MEKETLEPVIIGNCGTGISNVNAIIFNKCQVESFNVEEPTLKKENNKNILTSLEFEKIIEQTNVNVYIEDRAKNRESLIAIIKKLKRDSVEREVMLISEDLYGVTLRIEHDEDSIIRFTVVTEINLDSANANHLESNNYTDLDWYDIFEFNINEIEVKLTDEMYSSLVPTLQEYYKKLCNGEINNKFTV